jgi:hypothetical protein
MTNDEFERLQVKKLEHLSFTELEVELNYLNNLEWPSHRDDYTLTEITNEIDRRLDLWRPRGLLRFPVPSFTRMNRAAGGSI